MSAGDIVVRGPLDNPEEATGAVWRAVTAADSEGRVAILRVDMAGEEASGGIRHDQATTVVYVVSGAADLFHRSGVDRLEPGDVAVVPRAAAFALRTEAEAARLLVGVAPAREEAQQEPLRTLSSAFQAHGYVDARDGRAGQAEVILRPYDTQDAVRLDGVDYRLMVNGAETDSHMAVLRMEMQPTRGPIAHSHEHEDAFIYVLDGLLELRQDQRAVRVGPDRLILLPREMPHAFHAGVSDTTHALLVLSPAGAEAFVLEASSAARKRPAARSVSIDPRVAALAAEFGIDLRPDIESAFRRHTQTR